MDQLPNMDLWEYNVMVFHVFLVHTKGGGVLPLILTEKWVAFSAQLQSCSLKQFRTLTLELHLPHNYASINTQMGIPVIDYKQGRLGFWVPRLLLALQQLFITIVGS